MWKRLTRNCGGSTLSRLIQGTLSGKMDLWDPSSPMNYWASNENWSVSCLFDFSPRIDLQKLWCKECGMCIKLLSLRRWATQLQKSNEPCYESRFVILHGTNGESSLWMNKKVNKIVCTEHFKQRHEQCSKKQHTEKQSKILNEHFAKEWSARFSNTTQKFFPDIFQFLNMQCTL